LSVTVSPKTAQRADRVKVSPLFRFTFTSSESSDVLIVDQLVSRVVNVQASPVDEQSSLPTAVEAT